MARPWRGHLCIAALAMTALAACSTKTSSSAKEVCQSQAGAKVCLVPGSDETRYSMEASGFAPNSKLTVVVTGPSVPTTAPGTAPAPLQVDGTGHFPPAGGASSLSSGLVVPPGSGTITMMVVGASASGTPVHISLSVSSK